MRSTSCFSGLRPGLVGSAPVVAGFLFAAPAAAWAGWWFDMEEWFDDLPRGMQRAIIEFIVTILFITFLSICGYLINCLKAALKPAAAEPTRKNTVAASGEGKRSGILTWGVVALLVLGLGGGWYWWGIRPRMATKKLYQTVGRLTTAEVQSLLAAGADVKKYECDLLDKAACNEDPGVMKALLAAGLDVNATGEYSSGTALLRAAYCDNTEVLRVLLTAGADVNAKTKECMTALMYKARWNKNPDMVKMLLAAGADVDAVDVNGWTALMYAVGANPDKRRCVTYSSCGWQTGNPNPEVVKVLLQAGANVNANDKAGKTVLMHAAWWNHDPVVVVQMLLDAGADVHAVNDNGLTALMYAIDRKENESFFPYRREDNRAEKAEALIQLLLQSSRPQQQSGRRRGRGRRR